MLFGRDFDDTAEHPVGDVLERGFLEDGGGFFEAGDQPLRSAGPVAVAEVGEGVQRREHMREVVDVVVGRRQSKEVRLSGDVGVGEHRQHPDRVVVHRVFDGPASQAVVRHLFGECAPAGRFGIVRERAGGEGHTQRAQHRAVVRAPFGEVEDGVEAVGDDGFDGLVVVVAEDAAVADAFVARDVVGRYEKAVHWRDGAVVFGISGGDFGREDVDEFARHQQGVACLLCVADFAGDFVQEAIHRGSGGGSATGLRSRRGRCAG